MGTEPSTVNTLLTLAPYHLLLYSTLLGTTLYQSVVVTKICFQALPMSAFTTLQKKLFPAYFRLQTALTILTTLTFPPFGLTSLAKASWADSVPLGFMTGMALLNWAVYGPRTEKSMVERIHQQTKDSARIGSASPAEVEETKRIKKAFSRNHAMSIHLNYLAIGATIWYGLRVARWLKFEVE